jgi:hypothetical protein
MSDEFPRSADGLTVEMPKPTVWPMVLSLGIALRGVGAVTSPAFLVLGGAAAKPAGARADGGELRYSGVRGDYRVAIFTAPVPSRAGP